MMIPARTFIHTAALLATFALSTACFGPYVRTVKHPEDIRIYHDRLPLHGSSYRSLGVISVSKTRMGVGFYAWGWDWLRADEHGYSASSVAVAREMQALLDDTLIRKAREMGATAVVQVEYGASEVGWCGPIWGPFTLHFFSASGEAIQQ